MTNEPVDTASKERRRHAYHTTLLSYHKAHLPFRFDYSHVLPVNHHYVQRIVPATSPQSMNVGAWFENYGQFLLCKVSNIRSHSRATANQHFCCSKERKWDTKEDKGKSMMHAL